jgi:hypothetical protein
VFAADDVVRILGRLEEAQIDAWLHGGWGVDALLGKQTRPHEDLDLIVRVIDVSTMRDALERGVPGQCFLRGGNGGGSPGEMSHARSRDVVPFHRLRPGRDGPPRHAPTEREVRHAADASV